MARVKDQIKEILFRSFPQNFLIRRPYAGALFFFVVTFVFVVIYRPLNAHESGSFGFILTMVAYCAIVAIIELLIAMAISRTNCFSPKGIWTIANELLSVIIILSGIGISAYLAGFVMEPAASRWNFSTFIDSFSRAIMIGIIPAILPSLANIRYAFALDTFRSYEIKDKTKDDQEVLINIESKAKKEHLNFYPDEFIYAESDGNYVVFHLIRHDNSVDVTIRNSISEIEKQLSAIPSFMRTHRAFIVNLNKITSRRGNSLGYRLTLKDCNDVVPVSRVNVLKFDQRIG
ncbi:MAG: LytTR family DNA-binding domain-containing protein [Bacteroidales bacterium]